MTPSWCELVVAVAQLKREIKALKYGRKCTSRCWCFHQQPTEDGEHNINRILFLCMELEPDEHLKIGFYTATILNWNKLLKPDKYKEIVLGSLRFLVGEGRAKVYGFVIMPNHIHLLWKIEKQWRLEDVQRDFMKYTGQMIKFDLNNNHPKVLEHFYVGAKDRKYQFWERNSLTKHLDSREMVEQKLDYIHNNPVQGKWMLSEGPLGYKYSSARFYENEDTEFNFLTHYMEYFE